MGKVKKIRESLGKVNLLDAISLSIALIMLILFFYSIIDSKIIDIKVNEKYEDIIAIKDSLEKDIGILDKEYIDYKDSIGTALENKDSTYKYSKDSIILIKNKVDSLLTMYKDSIDDYYKQKLDSLKDIKKILSILEPKYENLLKQKEIINNKLKITNNKNDSLVIAIGNKDNDFNNLVKQLFSMSNGMEAYAEGIKYESFGDSEKGLFKSRIKQIDFYKNAKKYYIFADSLGIKQAKEKIKNIKYKLDKLDKDKVSGETTDI